MSRGGALERHRWAIPFEVSMLAGVVVTTVYHDWLHVATSTFSFIISLAPLFVERWFKVKIPALLHAVYVAFIFSSMFAGEVLHVYGIFYPWDDITHFLSGFVVAPYIMTWLVILRLRHLRFHAPIWFEALFIVTVTVFMSVLWEIAEFGSDQVFGTFSQGADLNDTMMDIIYGTLSGVIMGFAWVGYRKGKRIIVISSLMQRVEQLND